jgi:hypothetical protein
MCMSFSTCSRLGGTIFRLRMGGTATRLAGLAGTRPSSSACVKSAFRGMSMLRIVFAATPSAAREATSARTCERVTPASGTSPNSALARSSSRS